MIKKLSLRSAGSGPQAGRVLAPGPWPADAGVTELKQFMCKQVDVSDRVPARARSGGRWLPWVSKGLLLAGLLAAQPAAGAAATNALSSSDCLTCHDDKQLTKTGPAGSKVSLYVDFVKYSASVHGSNACRTCHADITEAPHPDKFAAKPPVCTSCHAAAVISYEASTHGAARGAGKTNAATCADCHGRHEIVRRGAPASPIHHLNLGATCGRCHAQIRETVQHSVHGQAMARGVREAPDCTDCHADHRIEGLRKATPLKIAEQVCSRCHASLRLNTKYKLPADRVTTFFASYHGMAARMGSTTVANCASCHGFHNILPASDPRSSVNRANMVKTCRQCHPGANENFAFGKVHLDETARTGIGDRINWWVRRVYLLLIVGVIGSMLVHNALVMIRKILLARRNRELTVVRLTLSQRIQHLLLSLSFIALALTGFALKYPDGWIAYLLGSSEEVRRLGHRAAAVVMLALAVYHTAYLFLTREGRKLLRELSPRLKDVRDVFANLRYLLSPRAPRPAFARFGYAEKAEYWAVVWGTVIMGLTGLVIWFKMTITQWVPRWVIEVAITIHYYEALLAVLAIVVWHFYHVFFDPDVYPYNSAWWDGRVPADLYREEHPLDRETLDAAGLAPHALPVKPEDGPKPPAAGASG